MIEQYDDYTTYLNAWIKSQENEGFGLRKKIADLLGVQTSYLSQVLSGKVVLKEDYALILNEYMRHDYLESDYFIVLLSIERASSHHLKNYYRNKAIELKDKLKLLIKESDQHVRLIDQENQYDEYYSSWVYSASHSLSAIDKIDYQKLSKKFNISEVLAKKIINYLSDLSLITKENESYRHSGRGLHLPKEHKWVNRHHINWKIKTLEVLQEQNKDNFHYTSIASCSFSEAEVIKELMRSTIREVRAQITKAKDEQLYLYSLDFFSV